MDLRLKGVIIMTSTAIGLAIGSLMLISSILLFISLWNTYFSTYVDALKAYSERVTFLSKAKMVISNITVSKYMYRDKIIIEHLTITLNNNGSVPIELNNFTFILIECFDHHYTLQKVIKTHIGSHGVKLSKPILLPGDYVDITVPVMISIRKPMCNYMKIIVSTGNGLKAIRIVSIS